MKKDAAEFTLPTQLIEEFAAGNGVIWLGAGCSVGSGLPSWEGLIRSMAQRLKDDGKMDIRDHHLGREVTNLEVAQLFRNLAGDHQYYEFLRSQIASRTISSISSPENATLQAVARLVNHFWPTPGITVVSTNYDTLLEEALLIEHGKKARAIVTPEDIATANAAKDLNVFKPNGDINHPQSLVLTLQDYCEYRHRKPTFVSTLADLFIKKTFLFVGYGLSDFTFNSILAELRATSGSFTRRAYVLAKDEWGIKKQVLQSLGLEVVPIADFDDLPYILRAISEQQPTVDIVRRRIRSLPSIVRKGFESWKLLLVEDDHLLLESVSWIFEEYKCKGYHGEADPEKALKLAQRNEYNIIITDLAMPRLHGLELIKKIRQTAKNKSAIIVVWSGFVEEDRCLEAGADFCFQKPTQLEEIFRILFQLKRLKEGSYQ